METEPLLS